MSSQISQHPTFQSSDEAAIRALYQQMMDAQASKISRAIMVDHKHIEDVPHEEIKKRAEVWKSVQACGTCA